MASAGLTEIQVNYSESKSYDEIDNFVPWDNPDNVITFETFSAIENILTCYFNSIIFCISVPANVLSCLVFLRQGSCSFYILSSSYSLLYLTIFIAIIVFLGAYRYARGPLCPSCAMPQTR